MSTSRGTPCTSTHTHTHTYIYIYIYITRLASNEIFSPSNKIHQEVGGAKDLSAQTVG